MALVPIDKYEAGWDQENNKYGIRIQVKGGQFIPLKINTEEEFSALLLLLSKSGVMVENTNGTIRIPPRPAGT